MKIYLSGDHAGFELKEKIRSFLKKKRIEVHDFGPYSKNSKDDYPDFVVPMARRVAKEKTPVGIICAGSGQGEAIAANKIKGIRAIVYYGGNIKIIKLGRKHNNANVLSFGARFVKEKEVLRAIKIFLNTMFEKGRHEKRIKKINTLGGK
jgi:ribose 5-phosphate isomerase B|tara:strand:- start:7054 stop:7503 length:450 start_codon:yes stop_codon:yes gene_type:complete